MKIISHPVLCNYYVTYRCNAKCDFCDIWEIPSPYVNIDEVTNNLKALKRLKVRVIDFTGGEPLLHRELPEFLRMAKTMGFMTTLTTNTLLYPKYAEQLAGNVDMLHFSLDSPDPELHNASRGVDCFGHLIKSIDIARTLGEKPDILFTVSNQNIEEIEQVYTDFVLDKGLLLILNPIFTYNDVGGKLSQSAILKLRGWAVRPNVYLNEAFVKLRLRGGNDIHDPVCRAGSSTIVITPHNKLRLPCYHLKKKDLQISNDLFTLYNSIAVQKMIKMEGRYEECQGCTINCYMEPSMAVNTGPYFAISLKSSVKYALEKWIY